jgi:hypothetical protein
MAGKQASFLDGDPIGSGERAPEEGLGPPTPSVQLLRWRGRTQWIKEGLLMGSPSAESGRTPHAAAS